MLRVFLLLLAVALFIIGCSENTKVNNDLSDRPVLEDTGEAQPGPTDSAKTSGKTYESPEGWKIAYPESWGRVETLDEETIIQETLTGKTISFSTVKCTKSELESWIDDEIERKLSATEADNTLVKPLAVEEGDLLCYTYTIESRMDGSVTELANVIYFDGERRYEFRASMPPVTEKEFEDVINSFEILR